MVVPVELDPGRHDPRSPYYEPPERERPPEPEPDWESIVQERIDQRKRPYPVREEAEAVAGPEGEQDGT